VGFEDYTWPMQKKEDKPFEHQKETVEFILRNKRSYILSDMGTGKTLCPLWAFDILWRIQRVKRMLIVTPLSTLKVVWVNEIFRNFPHLRYAVAHGSPSIRTAAMRGNAHIVIINHDGIKSVEEEILRAGFDIIVIDELTAFKNGMNDRSKCMQRISKKVKAVWGLTGNPTPNAPTEAYGQAKVVNPANPFLPRYYTQFKEMVEVEIAPYVTVPKPEAKDIVFKVLQPAIRFERDKCIDLPPAFYQDVEIEMTGEQQRAYDAIKKELLYEYDNGQITAVNAAVKLSKLLQISAGSVKDDTGTLYHLDTTSKMDDIMEIFDELGRTKLIVVSAFRASVERLTDAFKEKKIKCEYIHGDVSSNKRAGIIDNFQGGDLQILVVQPQAVAHGVTLHVANTTIWQSYVASGETYLQMNARITRAGQLRKQYIRHQVCSKAEQHVLNILTRKTDMSSSILKLFADRDL